MNQKKLFNNDWKFAKTGLDIKFENRNQWEVGLKNIDLPHDWLIYNTEDLYENSIAWYSKKWEYSKEGNSRCIIRFDGVYMDSTIYVNQQEIGQWKYGYSTFEWDITDVLLDGTNEVVVKVVHQSPNSRWYSGAGIYRNVWMIQVPENHIASDGIYTSTKETAEGYDLTVETELAWNHKTKEASYEIQYSLLDGEHIMFSSVCPVTVDVNNTQTFPIKNPERWDIQNPKLYQLKVELLQDNTAIHEEVIRIGFRTISFLPEKGFLLNGRKVRLNGVCEHHDFGALGAAFSKEAMKRKFDILREMGVNALRTSHNMPAVEVMDMADELGFIVVSEAFDMWETSKTEFDYARFFPDWAGKDVRSWIRRDRNHPSIIMWSIGNEIYDTHVSEYGQEITRRLINYVREHDPRENAPITIGSNFMPWENAQKCADIVKIAGYNYAEKYYEEHHNKYPDWVIYGSETSSVVQSRGIYHFPWERAILIEEDEQCSSLGNSTTSWAAKSPEYSITMDRDAEYSCGQFIWTGFDYIGEPTPYQTKNSYFGQIDTAGFPKDSYYLYQSEWTNYKENPMVHVYPYWDFNPGQMIDVRVCSNAPKVELFVNGKSLGCKDIDHLHGKELQGHWKVAYEPGNICAVAYDENGTEIARETRNSFGDSAAIVIKVNKTQLQANGEDLIFVEISTVDKDGNPVENAADYVEVNVEGAGRLVGLDNGDSTDFDQYKGTLRKLFSGKLLAIVAAGVEAGDITVTVRDVRNRIKEASISLKALPAPIREGISANTKNTFMPLSQVPTGFVPIRKIELTSQNGQILNAENKETVIQANCFPADFSDKELVWKAVNASGMDINIATIEPQGDSVKVTALGDGEFYIRCMTKNGTNKTKLISQLEMKIEGMGAAYMNPYEMIAGGRYNCSKGDVGSGPNNSVGTDKENETQIGFANLDFGDYGSDEVTISIFSTFSDAHDIQIWQGMPDEAGSELLADVIYQKPSEWEVFKSETYRLNKRLKGIATICFVMHQKVLIQGFTFRKPEVAFAKIDVVSYGKIYGDSFRIAEDSIEGIGNNVSLEYDEMDFGEKGMHSITICGRTPLKNNSIHVRFSGEEDVNHVVEFPHEDEYTCHTFQLEPIYGAQKVTFVFLPGCNFDFKWFKFE